MKDIPVVRGRRYILERIAEGEHECQDFKYSIGDAIKIARSLSAFANRSGGRLLIGVKDNGTVAGVRNEEDIYVVEQAAKMYCHPAQHPDFTAFKTDGGLTVIRVGIARALRRPVMVREASGQLLGYYRVADENILTPALVMKSWERIDRGNPNACAITPIGSRLLALASRSGGVTVEEFMRQTHLSRAATEELILSLCSMRLLEFSYHDGRFFITERTDTDL